MARNLWWLAGLMAYAGACAGDADRETLGGYAVEMQVAIDAMHAELAAHQDGVGQSFDPDEVETLEWMHMQDLAERMDRLQRAHEGVTMCGQHMTRMQAHAGMPALMAQNGAMRELLDEAYREIGRHMHGMDIAADRHLALAEEAEHARIMDELIGRMSAHCEGMLVALDDMGESAAIACPEYTRVPER